MTVIHCNKEQAEKILQKYFSTAPIITKVSMDDEDGIYFITAKTVPGFLRTEWQFRGSPETGQAMFGEVRKGDARYDLSHGYPEELMKLLNDACRKAIIKWNNGNDLFLDEEVQELKAAGAHIQHVVKSSDKKAWILCGVLAILLIIALLWK